MKNLTLIIFFTLNISLFTIHLNSQPCLPEGINFYNQTQIDSFQINYPSCTEIEGDVYISGPNITNLNGLNVITSIGGNLIIGDEWIQNPHLDNLTGLEGLTSIGGYLEFRGNEALYSLTGLDNLTSIGGGLGIGTESNGVNPALASIMALENLTTLGGALVIIGCSDLKSLTGLEGVNSIGSVLWIIFNESLTSFAGLDNVTSISGNLFISANNALTSFAGLDNVTSISGDLWINGNDSLTSLMGLENIESSSIINLDIINNISLSTCEVESICDYLVAPNGSIDIYDNASGCNSQEEVEDACENNCLPEGIIFNYQEGIDNFQINYPNCTEIEGDVNIGEWVTNLNGLNVLTAIGGSLGIVYTYNLPNLTGLDNVTSIGGHLTIAYNGALTSLTGLEGLTFIGGDIFMEGNPFASLGELEGLTSIEGHLALWSLHNLPSLTGLDNVISIDGNLDIRLNASLTNMTGLDNVTSIGGYLKIKNNDSLTNLTGLDNIDPNSIENMSIHGNGNLIECHVQSICEYMAVPNGTIEIYNNAPGCNSQEEVEATCDTLTVKKITFDNSFLISPNPCYGSVNLQYKIYDEGVLNLDIYDITGTKVKSITTDKKIPGTYEIEIDLSDLQKGVYFCVLKTNKGIQTTKMIKL